MININKKYKVPEFKYRASRELRDVMPEPEQNEKGGYGWLVLLLIVSLCIVANIAWAIVRR